MTLFLVSVLASLAALIIIGRLWMQRQSESLRADFYQALERVRELISSPALIPHQCFYLPVDRGMAYIEALTDARTTRQQVREDVYKSLSSANHDYLSALLSEVTRQVEQEQSLDNDRSLMCAFQNNDSWLRNKGDEPWYHAGEIIPSRKGRHRNHIKLLELREECHVRVSEAEEEIKKALEAQADERRAAIARWRANNFWLDMADVSFTNGGRILS